MTSGQETDIRTVVIDLGRLVGLHGSTRQTLPGTKKVWQSLERLNWAVQVCDAIGKRRWEQKHQHKYGMLKDPCRTTSRRGPLQDGWLPGNGRSSAGQHENLLHED